MSSVKATNPTKPTASQFNFPETELDKATIRFAGDSGDGMQLTGTRFSTTSVIAGNDVITFPDYPAEIRAPAGTLAGVSSFDLSFSSNEIFTTEDCLGVLVAMNPAALKANLQDLEKGGILIVNSDSFAENDLRKAEYSANPLETGELNDFRVVQIPITKLTLKAVEETGLSHRDGSRSKNFFDPMMTYHKIIVHGHTPVDKIEEFPCRINLDTGAFYSGKLTCFIGHSNNISYMDTKNE